MHKKFFFLLPVVLFCCSSTGRSQVQKKPRPNVVIIFMDDLGYGDLNAYGKHDYATPHLDRLAREGKRFTSFYSAQAVCSASRAALLTGCYPNRVGIWAALNPNSPIALDTSETTIASMLKKAGYKTGMVGKWHLGSRKPYLPLHHGFDEYLGLPYSNDMWSVNYDGKPMTDTSAYRYKYPPLPLIDGDEPVKYIRTLEDQGLLTRTYTERAVSFINRNARQPFFLYYAHSMPHVPLYASPEFLGRSRAGLLGDVIEEVDWSVGEILGTLEKNGILGNTLILFTSDNGPWLTFGNHAGSSGGLREGKGTAWEGGVRVPLLAYWKGHIQPGTVSGGLASTIDLLPTIASICGSALPEKKIDGMDVSGLFFKRKAESPRKEFVYYYDRNHLKAIRDGKWKLVFPHTSQTYLNEGAIGRDGFPGKTAQVNVPMALYDLEKDERETTDLQGAYPDVVKRLSVAADRYRRMLGDEITGIRGTENRPAAQVR